MKKVIKRRIVSAKCSFDQPRKQLQNQNINMKTRLK